jgi:hypothetical protein
MPRRNCTTGTRADVLKQIYEWAVDSSDTSPPVFWLTGQAGSGKTTIAYTVSEHFDMNGPDLHTLLATFFCSRQFDETRQRSKIIPTLAYQLAETSRSFARSLVKENPSDSIFDVLSRHMEDLLVKPWQESLQERSSLPPYLIVIDALDELDGNSGSDFLRDLLARTPGALRGLKFLVTSRPHPELQKQLEPRVFDARCNLFQIALDTVQQDILLFLKEQLPSLIPSEMSKIEKLAGQTNGLFIHAATAVRFILSSDSAISLPAFQVLALDTCPHTFRFKDIRPIMLNLLLQFRYMEAQAMVAQMLEAFEFSIPEDKPTIIVRVLLHQWA